MSGFWLIGVHACNPSVAEAETGGLRQSPKTKNTTALCVFPLHGNPIREVSQPTQATRPTELRHIRPKEKRHPHDERSQPRPTRIHAGNSARACAQSPEAGSTPAQARQRKSTASAGGRDPTIRRWEGLSPLPGRRRLWPRIACVSVGSASVLAASLLPSLRPRP